MNPVQFPPPVVIILTQSSVSLARRILQSLTGAQLYGLSARVTDADTYYQEFAPTLQDLFSKGTPIIGICAAGILIRTIAPLLNNKYLEPPVIAVAEDGSAVVPLLGGLQGANDLARIIASGLEIQPAITTTGDIRFRTTLLNPPAGYVLANPDDGKTFISNLLAGQTLKVEGDAPWLYNSKLPITDSGALTIKITEKNVPFYPNCLVYHPQKLIFIIATNKTKVDNSNHSVNSSIQHTKNISINPPDYSILDRENLTQSLQQANLSTHAIAGIFCPQADANHPQILELAHHLNRPIRFFPNQPALTPQEIGMGIAQHISGENHPPTIAIASTPELICMVVICPQIINAAEYGQGRGKLTVIGTGPGSSNLMSPQVKTVLESATDLVGYTTYLNLVGTLKPNQTRHDSDNREELDRARFALNLAATGKDVAVVSSGDPGIYAMAAAILEVIDRDKNPNWQTIDLEIAPGISAVQAAAAKVGAPIGHDFCLISLSDILKPWSIIEQRIQAAAEADFAIAFYNPVSRSRTWQLSQAKEILLQYRSPQTPVILGKNLTRAKEEVTILSLGELDITQVDMRTIIIVGSSHTRVIPKFGGGVWVYTPRWYEK